MTTSVSVYDDIQKYADDWREAHKAMKADWEQLPIPTTEDEAMTVLLLLLERLHRQRTALENRISEEIAFNPIADTLYFLPSYSGDIQSLICCWSVLKTFQSALELVPTVAARCKKMK